MTRVENMTSNSSYNKIANQFIITDDNGNTFFQSYQTVICKRDSQGRITLNRSMWDYSKTTGKYRNQFLGEDKKETERKIKEGIYSLADL